MINLPQGAYLIVATGTDIGKTFLLEKICQKLRDCKIIVSAVKPVASSFRDDDLQSDSAKILQALGRKITAENIAEITPWRFAAPLAPSLAAAAENKKIIFDEVKNFCAEKILQLQNENFHSQNLSGISAKAAVQNKNFLFIESAGGVMTPLSDDKTFLDLAVALKIPVLLLTANYLGAISHTLCAVEALRSKAISIERIIVNNFAAGQSSSEVKMADTITTIKNFSQIATITLDDFIIGL